MQSAPVSVRDRVQPASRGERSAVRLLQASAATSAFDRFVVGPLLLSVAADFGVTLAAVAAAASAYFLCYGISQPLWGLASDRLGRVRTMRLTLGLAAVAGVASALAPTLALLVVARALTGAFMAAAIPAGLIYIGDAVPFSRRQRTLTDLNAAIALGITAATSLGGVLAAAVSWRAAFLLPAVAAAVLVVVLRRLPEPPRSAVHQGGVLTVLRHRWGLAVLGLALVEGSALLGLLAYLAPALESTGSSPTAAGAVVALYGLGLLVASRVVKHLAGRTSPASFLAVGAGGLALAYAAVAARQDVWVVGPAALLIGASWAAMHSTMQAWATEVVPEARAVMVSLFAGMLFVGSGVATAALAPWAGDFRWAPLYLTGTVVALAFGAAAVTARAAYRRLPARPEVPPV